MYDVSRDNGWKRVCWTKQYNLYFIKLNQIKVVGNENMVSGYHIVRIVILIGLCVKKIYEYIP